MQQYVLSRAGQYYFNRRVPRRYKAFDSRKVIRVALFTDSHKQATSLAAIENGKLEAYWRTLSETNDTSNLRVYQNTVERAEALGFKYIASHELANGPLDEILERLKFIEKRFNHHDTEAVLGGVEQPEITLSESLSYYWDISRDKVVNKSANQIRKWENPRKLAIKILTKSIGNKSITKLTREDILKVRNDFLEEIQAGKLIVGTANKRLSHIKGVIGSINEHYKLNLNIDVLFRKIIISNDESSKREAFTTEHIVNVLLNPNNLLGLNDEAKNVLLAFSETGAGLAELIGLKKEDIRLNEDIPYISLTPRKGNLLKNKYRRRIIPLVGYALDAFKAYPNGFTNYSDKPDTLSTTLSKYLRENNLMPSAKHSVYSLRHSFQDRLRKAKTQERIQAELMGHKYFREAYGAPSLEEKFEELKKIQLKPNCYI